MSGSTSGTLADRLRGARARAFVGRERESAAFEAMLTGASPQHLLWLSGPGGIGKSSLLERLAERASAAGRGVVRLDAASFAATPRSLRDAFTAGVDSAAEGPLALFLDSAEALAHLDDWLRAEFLPELPADTLVVIASRQPPGVRWRADPGWAAELVSAPLAALTPSEVADFLDRRGLRASALRELVQQTAGYPLALALAAELLLRRRDGAAPSLSPAERRDLVGSLLERFLDGVPDPAQRLALNVLGHVRTTSLSLLRALLDDDAEAERCYTWLAGLSFVTTQEEGVAPHELARAALEEDLRWRDPDAWGRLRSAIRAHWRGRLLNPALAEQARAAAELLWQHRHSPALAALWDEADVAPVWVEPAVAADLPAIIDLAGRFEGPASAAIHRAWWGEQPEAFRVARTASEPVLGFLVHLRLGPDEGGDAQTQARRVGDPLAIAALGLVGQVAPLRAGEHLRVIRSWIGRDGYHRPTPTNRAFTAAVSREVMGERGLAVSVAYAVGEGTWTPLYAYADYARAAAGDASLDGIGFAAYLHDWRLTPPPEWLDLLDSRVGASAAGVDPGAARHIAGSDAVLSEARFHEAVRDAFRTLHDPAALAANPLLHARVLRDAAAAEGSEAGVDRLRAVLAAEVGALKQRPRRETAARALELTYLGSVRTQEAAAARLSLPFSTYRRHLATGVAEVAAALWRRELGGDPGR